MTDWLSDRKALVQPPADDPYGVAPTTAGRELDALVAEKVMGWTLVRFTTTRDLRGNPAEYPHIGHEVPHFSTDMRDAWDVFQHCCNWLFSQRSRFLAEIHIQAITKGGDVVAWPDVLVVLRHTMPEVICRAALAAEASRRASGSSDRE